MIRAILAAILCIFFIAQTHGAIRLKHHYGQTFVVFPRGATTTDSFVVYRSATAMDAGNYTSATQLARLPYDCYWNICLLAGYASKTFTNFVIDSMGQSLASDTGMFANTSKQHGTFYYGVAQVTGGSPMFLGSASIVEDSNEIPVPLWVDARVNAGKVEAVHLLQYMDFSKWNPRWQSYAYPYQLQIPSDYYTTSLRPDSTKKFRFSFMFHGLSAGSQSNTLGTVSGAGYFYLRVVDDDGDHRSTWHYGFANKCRANPTGIGAADDIAPGDTVFNYTQYRYLRMLEYMLCGKDWLPPDSNNLYLKGGSMGGTGVIEFLFHYPELFAGGYNSIGITNWINVGDSGSAGYKNGQGVRNWGPWTTDQLPWVDMYRREKGDTAIAAYWNGDNIWQRLSMNAYWIDSVYRPNLVEKTQTVYYLGKHNSNDMNVGWPENGYPFNLENSPLWEGKLHHEEYNEFGGHTSGDGVGPVAQGESYAKNKALFAMHNSTVDEIQASRDYRFPKGGMNQRVTWDPATTIDRAESLSVRVKYTPVMYPFESNYTPDPRYDNTQQCPYMGFPGAFTVDISPRRVQNFTVSPGQQYHWYRNGIDMGTATAQAARPGSPDGIVTIPNYYFHQGAATCTKTATLTTLTIKAGAGSIPEDVVAPGPISGLELVSNDPTSEFFGLGIYWANADSVQLVKRDYNLITLRFSAPGDDGSTGTCTRYVLRISGNSGDVATSPTIVRTLPAPVPAGQSVEFTFGSYFLSSGTYYMAVEAYDENNNSSGISNVISTSVTFSDNGGTILIHNNQLDSLLGTLGPEARLANAQALDLPLLGVWPNPFNPDAVIRCFVPARIAGNEVSLAVFDARGRCVKDFGTVRTGADNRFVWTGTDKAGATLASGMYVVRLKAKNSSLVRKITMMK